MTSIDDVFLTELISKSELDLLGIINNEDFDVTEIISELMKLLPFTEKPGLIIVKAKAADIYALQRDPVFKKEFADFRISVPKIDCLTIDTSKLCISTLSKDELDAMDFEINPDEITPETFRLLIRRRAFGIEPENTKKALSCAFRTGRLNTDDIATILNATWVDMSRLNEVLDLIES
jgi:hypothetical protein